MIMTILKIPIIIVSLVAILGVLLLQWIFPEFIFLLKYILYLVIMLITFTKGYELIDGQIKNPIVSMITALIFSVLIILLLGTISFNILLIIAIITIVGKVLL